MQREFCKGLSIRIIPQNPSTSDSIFFLTASASFGGDCTYHLAMDSIIDTTIYISGKFDSQAKCREKGANDTINIGLFSVGNYHIIYNFIDTSEHVNSVPPEMYTLDFIISNSVIFGQNIIDSIKIIPKNLSTSDSIFFLTASAPFGGDCTYHLTMDSIIDATIYISGKFDSQAKCKGKGANDTINIGLLRTGSYHIIYNFIDTSHHLNSIPPEMYTLDFIVAELGIPKLNHKNKVEIYPNPCNSLLNINFSSSNYKERALQLFNSFGQLVYKEKTNQNQLYINMNDYVRGIYFIKIIDDKTSVFKIVKE